MDIDAHAEELASALGEDTEEVKRDLENLLEYSVPIDEAKQSVRRKYGGGGGGDAAPSSVDIAEITPDSGNVTVTARVLTVGRRSIRYQGDDTVIREGELADETGTISYTAWQDFGFEAGDTVTVGNASVREWEGEPELNLGESSSVAMEGETLEVPYEIGGERDLVDLAAGDRGRTVEAKVLELEQRTIDGRDGETTIHSGVIGDETARLPFTDWQAREAVVEGAELRIEDVYVREFRGVPSVNLTEFTEVSPASVEVSDEAPRVSVGEAVTSGGMYDVEVLGNVLEVRDGSGLIERCPECGRLVQNGQCRSHGQVDPEDDLRVKAILDDGTATVTAILDRELTEEIYGGTLQDALEAARDAMSREVVADDIAETLVGREYRVRGHLSVDEYGANLDATEFEPSEDDPAARAADLLAEVDA
ncbi:Single-stranded DNA binding protein [Halobaculum magnesiiphilum]|uniref:Single-stranded DNA binding protein n=1 Tax=Halobaculum magnesiiphilum TaxID=1017351 RepID=A0A8T8WBW1_9EURY|nr:Single-stranded DNA binding protein [Halobaculum magnesiiphilum]QZP37306.1 Single-stranded DNA binding protein [Halobaculum magnesiiphilum]